MAAQETNGLTGVPSESLLSKYLGTIPQWISAIIACGALGVTIIIASVSNSNRKADHDAKSNDEHIAQLVDPKIRDSELRITSAIKDAAGDLKKDMNSRLSSSEQQITDLENRVGQMEGRFKQIDSTQKKINSRLSQQEAVTRLQDPTRPLIAIRYELHAAETANIELNPQVIEEYSNAIEALPASAGDYWTAVAAMINYRSFLLQRVGKAPNPVIVSRACEATGGRSNIFNGVKFTQCVVDLDTQTFNHATFKDCVIRYRGGETELNDVVFVNCRFVLIILPATTPAKTELLTALLNSPNPENITISK